MESVDGYILDVIISPIILSIGIIGNVFMLSILFRWMQKYHINFCFPTEKNRAHRIKSKKNRGNSHQDNPIHKSTSLNFSMCIYLSFLSFTDLLCLLMEYSFTIWRQKCLKDPECENLDGNEIIWASINLLVSLFNAFKGNTRI